MADELDLQPELDIQPEPVRPSLGQNAVAIGIGGAGAYGLGKLAQSGYEALAPQRTELAGRLVNSVIKPHHKEYMFGKNPGKAIAQEGIAGMNLDSIGAQVEGRLKTLNDYAKQLYSLEENQAKKVNIENAFEPFFRAVGELNKAPGTHKAKIDELNVMLDDLLNNIPEGMKASEVPLSLAHDVKDVVTKMQKWNVSNASDDLVNKSLKQVYGNIDKAIDSVIPEIASTNSRISNLISAKQAISRRAEVLSRTEPEKLLGLINNLPKLVANTATKTGLAKILAEKFAPIAKTGMTAMGVAPMISQALGQAQQLEEIKKQGGIGQFDIYGGVSPFKPEEYAT